jgi:hypothetical protein
MARLQQLSAVSLMSLLLLTACGTSSDGQRGGLTASRGGSGSLVQQSLMSSGEFGCEVVAEKEIVASGESFSLEVYVYNATGTARMPGTSLVADASGLITFSTSVTNTFGEDVDWTGTVNVADSKYTASCSFTITLLGGGSRRL